MRLRICDMGLWKWMQLPAVSVLNEWVVSLNDRGNQSKEGGLRYIHGFFVCEERTRTTRAVGDGAAHGVLPSDGVYP